MNSDRTIKNIPLAGSEAIRAARQAEFDDLVQQLAAVTGWKGAALDQAVTAWIDQFGRSGYLGPIDVLRVMIARAKAGVLDPLPSAQPHPGIAPHYYDRLDKLSHAASYQLRMAARSERISEEVRRSALDLYFDGLRVWEAGSAILREAVEYAAIAHRLATWQEAREHGTQ